MQSNGGDKVVVDIRVRVSVENRETVKRLAREAKVSMSKYIRNLVQREIEKNNG